MYEFYRKLVDDKKLKRSRRDLQTVYATIPETTGCAESLADCKAWCCEVQTPQVLYSEFLNTYWRISQDWTPAALAELFYRCVEIYVKGNPTNGCVFWNRESKQCSQHYSRPFNCRTYGQIPDEEFKPRFEKLKVLYEEKPGAVLRDQCSLCTSVGEKPTQQQMAEWFEQLKLIESDVGIPGYMVTDKEGGSYRTYHDHLLLQMAPASFLHSLTAIRTNQSEEAKDKWLASFKEELTKETKDGKSDAN